MADKLGMPLMPWQQHVAAVACEIDPATGLPAYREVRVTIPRQSGKTSLFLSWQLHRCVARRWRHPQRSAFTAQTGKDARDKWIDELFPLIRNSKLKALVAASGRGGLAINEGMGNESIRFRTGSVIRLLSSSASSGHSKTLDQAVVDELWHDIDDRREQGLRPAMITKRDAQLLVCSTAGTEQSVVLNRKIKTGREAALEDSGFGVAYFEWSAPDDWDPDDWDSYFTFSPALCPSPPCRCDPMGRWRHTITLDALKVERDSMELPEFKRAYGNVTAGQADLRWQVIAQDDWQDAGDPDSERPSPVAFAVTVSTDQQWATIAQAGPRPDGLQLVSIVDRREGTGWVLERLQALIEKWSPVAVVVDKGSPAAAVATELEEAGIELQGINAREVAAAAMAFYDGISGVRSKDPDTGAEGPDPRIIRHGNQPALNDAVAAAVKRLMSHGSTWTWDDPGSPLAAVSNALWGYRTRPVEVSQPFFAAVR